MLRKISRYFHSISAVLALIVWGGWAFYVNHSLGINERLISAFAQGIFSLVVTLLILSLVTYIYNKMPNNILRYLVPAILVVIVTGAVVISIHVAIDTAEIFSTVTPGLTVTFLYSLLTTYKLDFAAIKPDTREKTDEI